MLSILMPVAAAPLASLLPSPLHPAIVHLPMALVVLLPPAALVSLWIIRRGARPRAAWGVTLALLGVLAGSSWVATETGWWGKSTEGRYNTALGYASGDNITTG